MNKDKKYLNNLYFYLTVWRGIHCTVFEKCFDCSTVIKLEVAIYMATDTVAVL